MPSHRSTVGTTRVPGVSLMQDQCGYRGYSATKQGRTLFLIEIAFGTLPFSLAKFIDVKWDVIVGRGGQALFKWINHRVCTDCLMWIMETNPVFYELYTTLTFSWTSLSSLGPLPKFLWNHNDFTPETVIVLLPIDISGSECTYHNGSYDWMYSRQRRQCAPAGREDHSLGTSFILSEYIYPIPDALCL